MLFDTSMFIFFWWEWRLFCLMISSTVIDYFVAMKMDDAGRTENPTSSQPAVPAPQGTP